ncbi:S-phase kinase-associated protein 2-like [Asterias rubens]|uniref:S-phase kinase-associated protein 2-like n=1 Tax=Asterias rubens TaxID=7604 RepID=UPI001455D56B|nr:S-phase kinase-associated protein 2-like [Asterias rubens]
MIRRTRSRTAPNVALSSTSSNVNSKLNRRNSSQSCVKRTKTVLQGTEHLAPTFTWDVAKTDRKQIYDDLGVQEIDTSDVTASNRSHLSRNKRNASRELQKHSTSVDPKVKDQHDSPCEVKSMKEHIHDGHVCSCQKQLQLEKKNDPFYVLSDEIMLGVFQWLPKTTLTSCARVCKRWNHLVIDDSLWRHIDLASKIFSSGTLGRVLQRGTVAAKLSRCSIKGSVFDQASSASSSSARGARTSSRTSEQSKELQENSFQPKLHLQYLDLSASDATPEQLAEVLAHCPSNQLKKLSLESCPLSKDLVKCIANQGGSLEELNLCMSTGLKEDGVRIMFESCKRLKSLNLAWTSLSRKELLAFVECAPTSLEKLNLSGCRQTLKNEDVIALARNRCPFMKELDLSDSTSIGFTALEAMVECMTDLQHISLSRCYSLPRASFFNLTNLAHLRAIDVFGLNHEDGMIQEILPRVQINIYPFSSIARPTTTRKRNSIWEITCYE